MSSQRRLGLLLYISYSKFAIANHSVFQALTKSMHPIPRTNDLNYKKGKQSKAESYLQNYTNYPRMNHNTGSFSSLSFLPEVSKIY